MINPAATASTMTLASLAPAITEIALATGICAVLMFDVFAGRTWRYLTHGLTLVVLAVCAWLTVSVGAVENRTVLFDGLYVADRLGVFLKLAALMATALGLFYSQTYLDRRRMHGGEYDILAMTALLGICVLVSANSLLTVYLGVELLSLSLYALVAFDRDSGIAAEAAIKYFVLGAIASGALLYGMSMLYGLTGTLALDRIATVSAAHGAGFVIAVAFIIVAVAFKFGAVPFHMWVPDVYHGAPASVALLIATAPKLASFALVMRLLVYGLGGDPALWVQMLTVLAVLSLLLGNILAIAQTNIRRMLAYSAIANVGFILLGFITADAGGYRAALSYTLVYVLTTLGSFGVVLLAARSDGEADDLDDFKGLGARDPLLALLMLGLMLSTAGVPPLVGFWAKLWIIQALLHTHHLALAILAVLVSVIGAYYYLRVIWYMYFDAGRTQTPIARETGTRIALGLNTLAVLALGLLPNVLLALCTRLIGAP
jgi:NADH-quinone oxidoreductase subunit N